MQFRIGVLLISVLCMGCADQQQPDVSEQKSEPRNFILVASGDTHGWLMPCGCTSNQSGGLLRRGTYVDQLRNENELILVDVGGAADGVAPYQLQKFRAILSGESLMGVNVHNVGAAELAYGPQLLTLAKSDHSMPALISANVFDSNDQIAFDPLYSLNFDTTTIHVIGVVSPRFSGEGFKVRDPQEAILNVLQQNKIGSDWLVVIAYMNEEELRELAANLPEAHAIIGGPTTQALRPETVGRVLLTSATNKGKFLAELNFDGQRKKIAASIVEMSPEFEDHPVQEHNLELFRGILRDQDFAADESGLVNNSLWAVAANDLVAGTEACRECHQDIYAEWKESGHANAWARLVSENANYDSYCQQCHTTGFGWNGGFVSADRSLNRINVGCESCHGPSLSHVNDATKKTPFDARGQCMKCHDPENSPEFEFDSYWEKIHHD